MNSTGDTVRLGTERGFTHLYYCGQRQGSGGRSTGPETVCGPSGGVQCSLCEALQESLTNRVPPEGSEGVLGEHLVNAVWGDVQLPAGGGTAAPTRTSGLGVGSSASALTCDADTSAAQHALWRLLRVLLLQVSEQSHPEASSWARRSGGQGGLGGGLGPSGEARAKTLPDGWMGGAIRSLWDTLLLGINQLAKVVERESPATSLDCGRATVSGTRCIEAVSASSSPEQVNTHTHTHTHTHRHTHRHTHKHTIMCVCLCVFVCVCIIYMYVCIIYIIYMVLNIK